MPTYSDKPHVAQNPHPLTPRLQFLIPVGCQPTAPNEPKPLPFDTNTSVSTGFQHKAPNKLYVAQTRPFDTKTTCGTVQAAQAPRGPNPHHLIPRLQFQIPVGSQPTAPDKPHVAQTPPFDTKTSVSNPCRLPTYSDKPHVAQSPHPLTSRLQFLQVANIKHQTSPAWPKTPTLWHRTSVSTPCRLPNRPQMPQPHPLIPRLTCRLPTYSTDKPQVSL